MKRLAVLVAFLMIVAGAHVVAGAVFASGWIVRTILERLMS